MKVLVTGSSGRLGYYVVNDLLRAGHEVVLFDRRPPPPEFNHLPQVQGDISSIEDCQRALASADFDAIQHLAGVPYPSDHPHLRELAESQGVPFDATMRWNLLGTYYLLRAAVAAGVRIVVMTSSNCALGHNFRISGRPFPYRYLPVDEAHPPEPEDTYSFVKLAGEWLLACFTRAYRLLTYAVRATAICGPQERLEIARQARPAQGWHSGLWGWVAAEHVAEAHRLLMEQAHRLPPHDVFFCTADDTTALEPSLELVERFNPGLLPLVRAEELAGHASFHCCRRLKQAVGWRHDTTWRVT